MLKHQLIHPRINEILARAGHHSKILIADGNYPASTKKGPNAEVVCLNLAPGLVTVSQVLRAILSAVPVDHINTMGIPADDPYAQQGEPPVWAEFCEVVAEAGLQAKLEPIQKWDFYEAVASADHVLTVQTGDQALWANVLLTMGCRVPEVKVESNATKPAPKTTGPRIDSHQHFWNYDPTQYPWIQKEWPIRKSFLPRDLEPELKACGLDGCIAVQARQTVEESQWLLKLADESPLIKGVVGWADLRSPGLEKQLQQLTQHPRFVGVRQVVQDEPDDQFMLRKDFQKGISKLAKFGLTYDLLVFPRQLPAAIQLARKFPNQPFVLDHIAKPAIKAGKLDPWREQIQELATLPNVWCKVSGMLTEADWQGWTPDDFRPFLDLVFKAFGPARVMYGSDWPVALLAGTYRQVYSLARDYVQRFAPGAESGFFGGNAVQFYKLKI